MDLQALQQSRLLEMAQQTLAAPSGRGAFTAWTYWPQDATETLPIPPLVLSGRLPLSNAQLQLDATPLVPTYFDWSEFHNGVAAALRVRPGDDAGVADAGSTAAEPPGVYHSGGRRAVAHLDLAQPAAHRHRQPRRSAAGARAESSPAGAAHHRL
eukprot:ctg_4276.g624